MTGSSLYSQPDLYDLAAPADVELEAFYVEAARSVGGTVLELACGTGRLTFPLAKAGLTVTGGDLSKAMLERARLAGARHGLSPEFCEIDMRGFDLPGKKFDTVIVAANSLLHLHNGEDFSGFFTSVKKHLKPNGRLLFDVFVPSASILSRGPDERHLVTEGVHPELGRVVVEETLRYDPITQVSHIVWYWSTSSQKDFSRTPLELRQIFPQELPLLLSSGGFRLIDRYGDFNRSPLTPETWRQVCVCAPI